MGEHSSSPPIPDAAIDEFGVLGPDINALKEVLFEDFQRLDIAALKSQNGFRFAQLLLIVGGLVATLLGSIQAALPHSNWAGILEACVVAALGAVFSLSGQLNFKGDYLDQRLKAERLRAECFFYVARVGEYGALDADASRQLLEKRVDLIKSGDSGNA